MRVASFLLSLVGSASAAAVTADSLAVRTSPSVGAGCKALQKPLSDAVFLPKTNVYDYEAQNFWSNTEIMAPGCVFRPKSSEELAKGLKALVAANAEFAVRGGGHMGIRVSFPQNKSTALDRIGKLTFCRALTTSMVVFWLLCRT